MYSYVLGSQKLVIPVRYILNEDCTDLSFFYLVRMYDNSPLLYFITYDELNNNVEIHALAVADLGMHVVKVKGVL